MTAEPTSGPLDPAIFNRLTYTQQKALADVAFGGDGGGFSRKTLRSLAAKELIEPYDVILPGPRFGVRVTLYRMPIHVHIPFCSWAAELPEGWGDDE